MSEIFRLRASTIKSWVNGEIKKRQVCKILECSTRTAERYKLKFIAAGAQALKDKRSGHNFKLSKNQTEMVKSLKKKDGWRSSRNIRDKLSLSVDERQVQRILGKAGLSHFNRERVKPITRFEASFPNEMWQADIMGRIDLPKLGRVYLIGNLDDHSRFCPGAKFARTQNKINVFLVWLAALSRHGIPNSMLHDRGSQYKANTSYGKADYQLYAERLGIRLIWANKACTKGKIERFWRFVQDDFIRDAYGCLTMKQLNTKFQKWLHFYNYQYRSKYFGNKTHSELYHGSKRKLTKTELIKYLTIEERRRVTRESTISLYGQIYTVPRGYIGCHIWLKILGFNIYFVANDHIFYKTHIKN
jgi:transposase InsO family protein